MDRFITERQKNDGKLFCFFVRFDFSHNSSVKIFSNVRMGLPVEPVLSSAVDMSQLVKSTKP